MVVDSLDSRIDAAVVVLMTPLNYRLPYQMDFIVSKGTVRYSYLSIVKMELCLVGEY